MLSKKRRERGNVRSNSGTFCDRKVCDSRASPSSLLAECERKKGNGHRHLPGTTDKKEANKARCRRGEAISSNFLAAQVSQSSELLPSSISLVLLFSLPARRCCVRREPGCFLVIALRRSNTGSVGPARASRRKRRGDDEPLAALVASGNGLPASGVGCVWRTSSQAQHYVIDEQDSA